MYETMKVALPPEQMKWLEAEVSAGRFNSVDDAIAAAVAALMSARDDDLAWAKPYVNRPGPQWSAAMSYRARNSLNDSRAS